MNPLLLDQGDEGCRTGLRNAQSVNGGLRAESGPVRPRFWRISKQPWVKGISFCWNRNKFPRRLSCAAPSAFNQHSQALETSGVTVHRCTANWQARSMRPHITSLRPGKGTNHVLGTSFLGWKVGRSSLSRYSPRCAFDRCADEALLLLAPCLQQPVSVSGMSVSVCCESQNLQNNDFSAGSTRRKHCPSWCTAMRPTA